MKATIKFKIVLVKVTDVILCIIYGRGKDIIKTSMHLQTDSDKYLLTGKPYK